MPERESSPASADAPLPRRLLRWLPVAAWCGVIFALSSLPGSDVPGQWSVQSHFTEYAVLGLLAALCMRDARDPVRTAIVALALCSLYAISDELHQAFVPGRVPDVRDWATDTAGAAAAITIWVVAALKRRKARLVSANADAALEGSSGD